MTSLVCLASILLSQRLSLNARALSLPVAHWLTCGIAMSILSLRLSEPSALRLLLVLIFLHLI